jgi:phenylalanyl-tRNA synthetase beta chain
MKISYNWLKQYLDFNLTPKEIGEVLTDCGLEVEEIQTFESIPGGLEGVVVGEVKESMKHPEVDKLFVTKVDVGEIDLLQIVCGASNVQAGQKVAVALAGSTLYPSKGEKLTIKKIKIRGIESNGMICAEDEMGLGQSHEGILVLKSDTIVGTKTSDYFNIEKDSVFEIGLTPNRGDANSHIGVARDLYAALNVSGRAKVKFIKPDLSSFKTDTDNRTIIVEVLDHEACPRYSGITISNLTIKESPAWLKNKLKAIGVRSISNVVDITNYILHEYGQPLHAFDADKIRGGKIVVRHEAQNCLFKTLDGNDIQLNADDLIICDATGGMCIAGVYGGYDSGISENTKRIFLESAYFNPVSIRKTSIYHNLRTEAALHFEKACDPNITTEALKRAAILIKEYAGGEISSEIIDIYPKPIEGNRLIIYYERIIHLAGFFIDKETIKRILEYLEIKIEKESDDKLEILIPAFKNDVTREADIVEEILRIYGYNNVELAVELSSEFLAKVDYTHFYFQQFETAKLLSANGFQEIICNSLTSLSAFQNYFDPLNNVQVINSKSADLDTLRRSLITSGLETISHNNKRKQSNLKFFEFGKIYSKINTDYNEQRMLSLISTGNINEESWYAEDKNADIFHLLLMIKKLLTKYNIAYYKKDAENKLFDYCLELIDKNNKLLSIAGLLTKDITNRYDIKKDVFYAELNWDYILSLEKTLNYYREISKFPEVRRDLSLIINKEVTYAELESLVLEKTNNLIKKINVFDIYEHESLGKNKKSYSLSFTLQSDEKTLIDEEIDAVVNKLINLFESKLGAVIRK